MTQGIAKLSPLRKWTMAALVTIVCAQTVAMTMVARSQVQKAELREAAEAFRREAIAPGADVGAGRTSRPIKVGYAGYVGSR